MRSFTNKKGEKITVSKEHLDRAVELKIELQKASPSGRCSWSKLVQMMKEEGFEEAENSENYRCMIKSYQKSIGELPEAEKYTEMVVDKKIDSLKKLIGEISYEKRFAQQEFRKLNKIKRDFQDYLILTEQIDEYFKNYDWRALSFNQRPIPVTEKKMGVFPTDLHTGATINLPVNVFNYEVLKNRMEEYLSYIIDDIQKHKVSEVHTVLLGDVIEQPYMHNFAYNSEFTLAEQIVRAADLVIKFLVKLQEFARVYYAGIGGNHDRIFEDKNKVFEGDHAVKIVNEFVKLFIKNAGTDRIIYQQAEDYAYRLQLNGVNIKCVHGDFENINDRNILARHSLDDNVDYSILVMGHYHHYFVKEVGNNKFIVGFGSMKGIDEYGYKKKLLNTPSQGIILVDERGNFEIKRVKLT